jgi:hypothetical protein
MNSNESRIPPGKWADWRVKDGHYLSRFPKRFKLHPSPSGADSFRWMDCICFCGLGSLLLSGYRWFQSFGPEVLFFVFAIVLLASVPYGSYLFIQLARERVSRR